MREKVKFFRGRNNGLDWPVSRCREFLWCSKMSKILFRSELAPFADKYFISDPKRFSFKFSGLASETLKLAGGTKSMIRGLSTYSDPARFYIVIGRDKSNGKTWRSHLQTIRPQIRKIFKNFNGITFSPAF